MKYLRKSLSKILSAAIVVGLLILTGCSIFKNDNNEPKKLSRPELEKLEEEVDPLVEEYFNDKYGIKAVVTHKGISGGVFLGKSKGLYYHVTVNINEEEYFVDVYANDNEELYVKKEAYYSKVIKDRMEEWLNRYVKKTNIEEYYISFLSCSTIYFPSEFDADYSAEEIIKSAGEIEDKKERPQITFDVIIPQSEYEKISDIEREFSELKSDVSLINENMEVCLNVCKDDDYSRITNGQNFIYERIEKILITELN